MQQVSVGNMFGLVVLVVHNFARAIHVTHCTSQLLIQLARMPSW